MKKHFLRMFLLVPLLFSFPLVSYQDPHTPAVAQADDLLDVETLYQHSEWCDYADGTEYGWSVAMGDVDGDMFDDIVVAAEDDNTTYVHYGSVTAETYWLPSSVPLSGDLATSDLNGDGRSDVVVGSWGLVRVYFGTQDRTLFGSTSWETTITVSNPFRTYVAPLGDVNSDGVDDIVVGFPDDSLAYVIYGNDQAGGNPQGPTSIEYVVFANARGHAGDVNDDGYPDVLRRTPGSGSVQPSVSLYLGTTAQMDDPNRVAATPAWTVSGIADTTL